MHRASPLWRGDLPGPGATFDLLEVAAGPERIHVEVALLRPVALVIARGHGEVRELTGPAGAGDERPLLHDDQARLVAGGGQLHPDIAVGLADDVDAGRRVLVQVDAIDEPAADLMLQRGAVVGAAVEPALEHGPRPGLGQHRLQVAAQFAGRELLVAVLVAIDRDDGVPAGALDPVQAVADPEREARVGADVRAVLRTVTCGQREEGQFAERHRAGRHAADIEREQGHGIAVAVVHDIARGRRRAMLRRKFLRGGFLLRLAPGSGRVGLRRGRRVRCLPGLRRTAAAGRQRQRQRARHSCSLPHLHAPS